MILVVGGHGGFLAASVGVAFDDEFVGGELQPVECGLSELGFGEWGGVAPHEFHGSPPGRCVFLAGAKGA